jgi:hypothetical protein
VTIDTPDQEATMHRQTRERIIALEVMKLERRQALERAQGERRTRAQRPHELRAPKRP